MRRRSIAQDDSVTFVKLVESFCVKPFEPLRNDGLVFWPDPSRAQIGKRTIVRRITQSSNASSDLGVCLD